MAKSPSVLEQARPIQDLQKRINREAHSFELVPSAVAGKLVIGLPLPTLALRYLFQSTIYPLGRNCQIVGPKGSCKSALLSEFIRFHILCDGIGAVVETEYKDASGLRNAIYQHNPLWLDRVTTCGAYTMEDQQSAVTTLLRVCREREDDIKTSNPVAVGIDSLTASAPEELLEKILTQGHADRQHPLAALMISGYLRTMPTQLSDLPFSVIATNHLKPGTDNQGRPTANVPGGKSMGFMETFEVRCDAIGSIAVNAYHGLKIKLKCEKCCVGESKKEIYVDFVWWYRQDENGQTIQYALWDWYKASIEVLLNVSKESKSLYAECQEICDINVANAGYCWSRALGIPQDEPKHFSDAGQLLEYHPEIFNALYCKLGILPYTQFDPTQKYAKQMDALKRQLLAEFEQRLLTATVKPNPLEGLPDGQT